MAAQNQFRSISLPSRLHPNPTKIEAQLYKLKSNKAYSLTSEAIQSSLVKLASLYTSVEEFMRSPSTQKPLDGKIVEEALESSVKLLDSSETIRELALLMKQHVQALQSVIRRKGAQDSTIQDELNEYLCFRKKMNKCIAKSLKKLKHFECRKGSTNLVLDDASSTSLMITEASNIAISVFRNLLLFLSSPASTTKWSLVSKMMIKKNENSHIIRDVGGVDFALDSLRSSIRSNNVTADDMQMVQVKLKKLDDSIEGLELGLERMFRQLVQNRVTLLNILTNH